jgi:hypothetical protein
MRTRPARTLAREAPAGHAKVREPRIHRTAALARRLSRLGTRERAVALVTAPRPAREHLAAIVPVPGSPSHLCEDCFADSSGGITLRVCLTCGKVGCAEGSASNHASEHYAETDHPIAEALGPEPPSRWCYPDQRFI